MCRGIWLRVPYWLTSLTISGVCAALMYRVVTAAIDGVAGLLAPLLLIACLEFRYLGLMAMSNSVALMLGLAIVLAWLRWRRNKTLVNTALIGFCAGWAAITRPADALVFFIPVLLATCWDLREIAWKRRFVLISVACAAAAIFFVLQLAFNHGVTGEWLRTPHSKYVAEFHPGLEYGSFTTSPTSRPQSSLLQKQFYYDQFVAPAVRSYTPGRAPAIWWHERFPLIFKTALPFPLLWVLVPLGLRRVFTVPRLVLIATFPLFIFVYAGSKIFASQYALPLAAAFIPLFLMGLSVLEVSSGKMRSFLSPVLAVIVLGITLMCLPQFNPGVNDQYPAREVEAAERSLETLPGPAVVMFRYEPGDNVHEEPVYNTTTAEIDQATVVRAHDLGPRENIKLYDYYAAHGPARRFYRFDRRTRQLRAMDPVKEWHDSATETAATVR